MASDEELLRDVDEVTTVLRVADAVILAAVRDGTLYAGGDRDGVVMAHYEADPAALARRIVGLHAVALVGGAQVDVHVTVHLAHRGERPPNPELTPALLTVVALEQGIPLADPIEAREAVWRDGDG